jgi:outer membrane protein OmpA-like peptidoglycan-associated protein
MNRIIYAAAITSLLAACAVTPQRDEPIEQARAEIATLSQEPLAQQAAARDLEAARDRLHEAEAALQRREPLTAVDHLAYLARRHAQAGEARVAEARSRQEVARAAEERNRILLEARSRESHEAVRQAREHAQAAHEQAAVAQQQAQAAQEALANTQQQAHEQAQAAHEQAAAAQQQAQAAQEALASTQQQAHEQAQAAREQAAAAQQQAQAAQEALANTQQQLAALQARKTDRGMVVTLGDVLFDTGQATLKPGADLGLDRIYSFMTANPQTKLVIEGHTDSQGSDEYNDALSERRAKAVANALVARGIAAERLHPIGRGKHYPVATNETSAGRQHNRRVEIVFSDAAGRFADAEMEQGVRR